MQRTRWPTQMTVIEIKPHRPRGLKCKEQLQEASAARYANLLTRPLYFTTIYAVVFCVGCHRDLALSVDS